MKLWCLVTVESLYEQHWIAVCWEREKLPVEYENNRSSPRELAPWMCLLLLAMLDKVRVGEGKCCLSDASSFCFLLQEEDEEPLNSPAPSPTWVPASIFPGRGNINLVNANFTARDLGTFSIRKKRGGYFNCFESCMWMYGKNWYNKLNAFNLINAGRIILIGKLQRKTLGHNFLAFCLW